ncbi:ribosomal-processing cysteine protease Prp [Candidatus Phytoplasma sacchari]|uniref:Ribosomal processing cysteine protease Prp n=1 Tax=Candidatus Phytoplasma sacchari TaxID=2609813 RepID=A0ABY7M1W3_9MOLU|nr:ribosomal-processing cysteine protease Prp [Candidatus Phytoplasma sacchari]KAB8122152.1 ribosomal-processing cysteine protease Prp [Candidatus Phytoplasma sacchari]WBL31375.1 ribosomal-processing cysteine protease Prp [Candidatus Phytoplasma sacchari]
MIKYFFLKNNNLIEKINIKGHSLYSTEGNDIVCSSISTAIIMTINLVEILGLQKNVKYILSKGNFYLKVLIFDKMINNLLKNLEYTLKDLNKIYFKNLKEEKI